MCGYVIWDERRLVEMDLSKFIANQWNQLKTAPELDEIEGDNPWLSDMREITDVPCPK